MQGTARPTTALLHMFQFFEQLLLQMSPRSLLNRATLGGYPLLLRLTFAPRSRFHRLRHVPDLWPKGADLSLLCFCVRIHECLALTVHDKDNRNRGKLKNHRKERHGHDRSAVKQSHYCAADKPRNPVSGIKQAERRASFLRWNNTGQYRLKERSLCAQIPPKIIPISAKTVEPRKTKGAPAAEMTNANKETFAPNLSNKRPSGIDASALLAIATA